MRQVRTHRLDAALLAYSSVLLVLALLESDRGLRFGSAGMAAAVLILLARNWRPPLAVVVAFVVVAGAMHLGPRASAPMFLGLLAMFAVTGTLATRWAAVTGLVVGITTLVVSMLGNPYVEGVSDVALTSTFCAVMWLAGLVATEHGRAADTAEQQARRVTERRDLDVAEATAHERSRIAGELHDVVSHGLSVVIVQTVAARMMVRDLGVAVGPGLDHRLGAVESTAREGLADMRRMLDLLVPEPEVRPGDALAAPGDDGAPAPAVGLREVDGLVETARSAGLSIDLDLATDGLCVPSGLGTTAYRIVQEALTNALRHASGAHVTVAIAVEDGPPRLTLVVRNGPGHGPSGLVQGAGYGLIGMRQRALLYGGTLQAGPRPDGYEVRATLPLGNPT